MMFCWCTLVLLTLVPVVTGDNTGVTVKLTQRGLDLVAGKAIEKLKQYIRNMDIPDQTLSIPMNPYIIGMKVQINEFKAVQALVPTTGVTLTIKSAKIQVSGNLEKGTVKLPFNVDVDTLTITATVAVEVKTGHLTLNIKNCKTEIGPFRTDPLRSLSTLLSWFNSFFPDFLGERVCSVMTTKLADFNPQLATLNDKVREFTGIDFSMEPAVISSDSIELSFVGLNGRKKRRLLEETKTLLRINI